MLMSQCLPTAPLSLYKISFHCSLISFLSSLPLPKSLILSLFVVLLPASMTKQHSYKFQSCILKVNIHCEGCEQKVKKLLHKVDGVYSVNVDAESGRVLVAGNVDPAKLIKKLKGSGKHAEIWGGQRGVNVYHQNQNQNQNFSLTNQFQNMQFDPSKLGKQNDSQKNWKNQQKGQPVQQLPQFQNKGAKDVMIPHKSVKFNLPQDDFHASDDGLDEFDDDEEFDDDFDEEEEDEELEHRHGNPMMMPNKMNMNMMGGNGVGNGRGPHGPGGTMNGNKGKGGSGGKKGGDVIDLPIQIKGKGGKKSNGESEWGGSKKDKGGKQKAGNKGGEKKKNGKSSGGLLGRFLGFGKKSKKGGGGADTTTKFKKNGVPIGNYKPKEAKNKGHDFKKIDHDYDIPMKGNGNSKNGSNGMGKMGPPVGHRGGQMGPMGNNYPMEQMRNMAAVQGLPATGGMNGGYYQGMQMPMQMQMPMPMQTPHPLPYNQQQQQYMAMMMNQQQANMYGRPQGHMNYMPPPPMPSHPMADPITHVFSDENTESCTIM